MAESGGLENRCVREGTVGSNPTPSAAVRITTFGEFRHYSAVRSLGHRMNPIHTWSTLVISNTTSPADTTVAVCG